MIKTRVENIYGDIEYLVDGILHREDGPALIRSDGDEIWYFNEKLHREDGPAYICTTGLNIWYYNGKIHRKDGPAIAWEYEDDKQWYFDGKCYGQNNDFTKESWQKFIKTIIFS